MCAVMASTLVATQGIMGRLRSMRSSRSAHAGGSNKTGLQLIWSCAHLRIANDHGKTLAPQHVDVVAAVAARQRGRVREAQLLAHILQSLHVHGWQGHPL